MKSKEAKLYVYYTNNGKEIVFKAYSKEDIRKHLGVTKYNIGTNCWEESSLSVNTYYDEADIVDLTDQKEGGK